MSSDPFRFYADMQRAVPADSVAETSSCWVMPSNTAIWNFSIIRVTVWAEQIYFPISAAMFSMMFQQPMWTNFFRQTGKPVRGPARLFYDQSYTYVYLVATIPWRPIWSCNMSVSMFSGSLNSMLASVKLHKSPFWRQAPCRHSPFVTYVKFSVILGSNFRYQWRPSQGIWNATLLAQYPKSITYIVA